MNVLHINCNYIGNHVHRNMIEALSKNSNINNKVFVPVYKIPKDEYKDNVKISKCFKKWDRISFYYKTDKIQKNILNSYNFENIDIIHAYTLFTDGNIAYELNKRFDIPYVVTIRNTDLNDFFRYRPYLKKRGIEILKKADAIIFLSKVYEESLFTKYLSMDLKSKLQNKIYILPNGIDDFWINNKYLKNKDIDKTLNIIYAGRIDKNKNIFSTQKALNILREEGFNIKYTIVGKIVDKRIYNKVIKDKNTKYVQSMPKEELINLYRDNDIFVMPSFTETFGMVYIEAMSQGLPVIYTKGQGFDGQFDDGEVGYSVNEKSPEDISNKILKIIANYENISINCEKNCIKFNWNDICEKYYNIYSKILKNN